MPLPIVAYRSNAEFVRAYFRSHPAATVREAVRAASQARQGLHWEEVARLHREMLPELRTLGAALQQQVQPLAVKPHPPLQQRPRTPVEILREAVPLAPPPKPETPQEAAPQPTGETMPPKQKGTHLAKHKVPLLDVSADDLRIGRNKYPGAPVRKRYLNAYLDKYPDSTAAECLKAITDTFGIGVGLHYVAETVELHRAARVAPPVKPPPAEAPAAPPAPQAAAPLPSPPPQPPAAPVATQALVQWGPPGFPAMSGPPTLEEELRAMAGRLKSIAEAHGVSSVSLVMGPERKVQVSVVRATTLEA